LQATHEPLLQLKTVHPGLQLTPPPGSGTGCAENAAIGINKVKKRKYFKIVPRSKILSKNSSTEEVRNSVGCHIFCNKT
jgi:hypothetical protein